MESWKEKILREEQERIDHFFSNAGYKELRKSFAAERPDYQKWKARKAIELGLRYGRITKPKNCELCGLETKLEAHHHDYEKPLEVEWICRKCHVLSHFPPKPVVT